MRGFQGDSKQLNTEVNTLANLGINTVITGNAALGYPPSSPYYSPDYEWPGLDVNEVQSILNESGVNKRSAAVYNPLQGFPTLPGIDPIFYFYLTDPKTPKLDDWAKQIAKVLSDSYGDSFGELVDFKLRDEPGWYYPAILEIVNNNPTYLKDFQDYLRNHSSLNWTDFVPDAGTIRELRQRGQVQLH